MLTYDLSVLLVTELDTINIPPDMLNNNKINVMH